MGLSALVGKVAGDALSAREARKAVSARARADVKIAKIRRKQAGTLASAAVVGLSIVGLATVLTFAVKG